jgi:hypothetical protein
VEIDPGGCAGVKMQRFPVMFMGFQVISGDFCGISGDLAWDFTKKTLEFHRV